MSKPMFTGKQDLIWPNYFQSSYISFILFLIYIPYWYLQGSFRFPFLGEIRFEFILGATLSILGILAYIKNPNRDKTGLIFWIGSLFFIMIVMVVFSYVPQISFDIFIDRVIKFALLGFFIFAFVTSPKRLGLFIFVYFIAFFKMGQEGLLGNITGSLVWENQGVLRLNGPTPNYSHPNSFSGMALGTLPFIYYFFFIVSNRLRLLLIIQLIFSLNIIIFTGSRTGYVAFGIGLIFLVMKSKNKIKSLLILIITGITITPLIPGDYIERAQTIFSQTDKEGNSTGLRKEILRDAWNVFLQNPLGVGVGAFPAVRQQRFGRTQDTHNLYLEIGTNIGIQGLIIFIGLIISILRALSSLTKNIESQINSLQCLILKKSYLNSKLQSIQEHLKDLYVIKATCQSVYLFIIIRLGLGLFGMDLYEVYWWFACGTTIAVWNINAIARYRSSIICSQSVGEPNCKEV